MIPAVNLQFMPRVIHNVSSSKPLNNAYIYEKIKVVAWVYINIPPSYILEKYAFLGKTVRNIVILKRLEYGLNGYFLHKFTFFNFV